jgi:hypothetical protein
MATYDGQILFFKDNGEQLQERLTVPRLRVRRDWHVGLNMDHVDHSHPDVSDPGISKEVSLVLVISMQMVSEVMCIHLVPICFFFLIGVCARARVYVCV